MNTPWGTFEDYLVAVARDYAKYANENNTVKYGQVAANLLYSCRRDIEVKIDPFYDDSLISEFFNQVAEAWSPKNTTKPQ